MKDINRPMKYLKCRCVEGQEPDWEHLNESCIGIHLTLRKLIGIILPLLTIFCYYEAITTIIYTEEVFVFCGTLIAAFIFIFSAIYVLRVRTMREVSLRCKKYELETIINFKGK